MEWEPSTAGMRVYTWSGNQSQEGNKYVYMEWEPITGGMIGYTWSGNQSQEGREYILGVGTKHRRDDSIYRIFWALRLTSFGSLANNSLILYIS